MTELVGPYPHRALPIIAHSQRSKVSAFHLHQTALYNSIFRYDDQMLVNQHIYGTYGYFGARSCILPVVSKEPIYSIPT